jgi:hypothetical protein
MVADSQKPPSDRLKVPDSGVEALASRPEVKVAQEGGGRYTSAKKSGTLLRLSSGKVMVQEKPMRPPWRMLREGGRGGGAGA